MQAPQLTEFEINIQKLRKILQERAKSPALTLDVILEDYAILLNKKTHAQLVQLAPGQSLTINGGKQHSLSIVRSLNGSYLCFDEDPSHTRIRRAYRIDNYPLEEYEAQVTQYSPAIHVRKDKFTHKSSAKQYIANITHALKVHNYLAEIAPEYFAPIYGFTEQHDGVVEVHTYTKPMQNNLADLIASGVLDHNYKGKEYPGLDRRVVSVLGLNIEFCKLEVFMQIVDAIRIMHKRNFAHKLLNVSNIGVEYLESTKQLQIKINNVKGFSLDDDPFMRKKREIDPPEYKYLHLMHGVDQTNYAELNEKHDIWTLGIILINLMHINFTDTRSYDQLIETIQQQEMIFELLLNPYFEYRSDALELYELCAGAYHKISGKTKSNNIPIQNVYHLPKSNAVDRQKERDRTISKLDDDKPTKLTNTFIIIETSLEGSLKRQCSLPELGKKIVTIIELLEQSQGNKDKYDFKILKALQRALSKNDLGVLIKQNQKHLSDSKRKSIGSMFAKLPIGSLKKNNSDESSNSSFGSTNGTNNASALYKDIEKYIIYKIGNSLTDAKSDPKSPKLSEKYKALISRCIDHDELLPGEHTSFKE